MSQPENYTAAQASDPSTPAQVLADIAAQRPDLRPAVAANPSTYPGLLEWLRNLGDPAVDAALAARPAAPAETPATPAEAPTQVMPTAQAPQPVEQPTQPMAPVGAPAPQPWGPQPGAPAPGYGPPAGMPPQGYTPGYAGTPPTSKSSKTALWIILGIVALLVVGGVVTAILVTRAASDAIDRATDILPTPIGTTEPDDDDIDIADARDYGDNAVLDALWDACADEDWAACDDLYRQATRDTAYWNFGDTCGGAWDANTTDWCVDAMTGGATGDDEFDDSGITEAQRIWFEALASACGAGDWDACDFLYMQTPVGSSYEHFGNTCGGAGDGTFWCDLEFGDGVDPDRMTRGSDPGFDALWIACEGGLVEACDLLYWESPADSEYEAFARDRM